MSDEKRDGATGQFTSAEPAYGLESVERDAGYVPYKPEGKEEPSDEGLTVAEAAERYLSRTAKGGLITYGAVDHLPDNVSLTVDQAHKLVGERKAAEAKAQEEAEDNKFRDEIDELRGVKPDAKKTAEPAVEQAEPVKPGELDPEIEKALSNPKIQAAIAQHVGEVETARQQHMAAVDGAAHIAVATFMGQFPEFANIPQENMGAAIQAMQQQDPGRAAQVAAHIQRTLHIFDQQKALHGQEAHAKQARFQEYARAEDEKFNALVKGETAQTMKAVPALIREALEEYGVDPAEFGRLGMESEFLRSAAAQRLLVDAAKYRQISKAAKPVPSRPPVPKVQRPGNAKSVGERDTGNLAALGQQLSHSGSIDDAYALYKARKRG